MRKNIVISAVAVGLLSSVNVYGAEDLSSMFSNGKVSGQIREFSISRTYKKSDNSGYTRNGNAIGGHLTYETDDFRGLSLGAAFYTTNAFARSNEKSSKTTDPSLFGSNNDSYSILGEAYLQYKFGKTLFKGGRQMLNTPLAGADDVRMLPDLFEAYILTNKDISDTTLVVGHLSKFAQGTFGRVYSSGLLSATSGYSNVDSKNQVGGFVNMGTYATGTSTSGVTFGSVTYTGIKGLKVQLWDYYAHDISNSIYGQADLKWNCLFSDSVKPFASVQVIKQSDVGDKLLGKLDGTLVGGKIGAKVNNVTAYVAYTQTGKNSSSEAASGGYENSIVTMWGGMPGFTQGMVTRHMFLAGTKATKVGAVYNFKDLGANATAAVYYLSHKMDENSGYGVSRRATEPGFDIKYYPEAVKNLQVRLRGNFPRKFAESTSGTKTGWNEYRFIVNYNF